jgi:hypothetical protein
MYFVHEGGADYPFVVRRLTALFEEQGVFPPEGALENRPVPVRAVGLIFGRPTCRVFKDELLPDQAYYNLRSDKNMELFYMGYAPSKEQPFKRQFDEHDFDNQSFVGAVGDFEHRTKWSYSGETDLILLNSWLSPEGEASLDFSSVLALNLEQAEDTKLIASARVFLEEIMRQSREQPGQDVVIRSSDILALRSGRTTFFSWIAGLLKLKPEDLGNLYHSCVRDVSLPAAGA